MLFREKKLAPRNQTRTNLIRTFRRKLSLQVVRITNVVLCRANSCYYSAVEDWSKEYEDT